MGWENIVEAEIVEAQFMSWSLLAVLAAIAYLVVALLPSKRR